MKKQILMAMVLVAMATTFHAQAEEATAPGTQQCEASGSYSDTDNNIISQFLGNMPISMIASINGAPPQQIAAILDSYGCARQPASNH